jgi:hypothetical protein
MPSVTFECWTVDVSKGIMIFEGRVREVEVLQGSYKIQIVISVLRLVKVYAWVVGRYQLMDSTVRLIFLCPSDLIINVPCILCHQIFLRLQSQKYNQSVFRTCSM